MLRCCAESGLPVVVLAADDGWRWPRGLPVAELRPADLCEARDLTAEAFNIAERRGVPVVVRAGAGLLGRWEASARQPAARPIVRGAWASGPQAGPEARAVPGQEGSIRVIKPLPADVLTRRRAALDEAEPPSEAALPQTSPLFPAPAAATLEEREPRRPEDFAPEGSDAALLLLARAWSEQGLQPKDIFVAVGGVPCRPRTYGALVPAGCAAAVAMGAKLANPALTVAALDDSEAVFSRGLAQLLHAARGDHDILVLLWERGAERAFELVKAQRLPAQDEAAAAAQLSQAVAHKGLSLAVCPCPAGLSAVPGAQDVQAYGEAPVTAAIDRRPALCARLLEELA
ncbi:MAG: hypothetical protein HY926_15815, partial [Elusimicrobia bacterium]|nr:hypothetical protein [Elusimicrobiota bacterium]